MGDWNSIGGGFRGNEGGNDRFRDDNFRGGEGVMRRETGFWDDFRGGPGGREDNGRGEFRDDYYGDQGIRDEPISQLRR